MLKNETIESNQLPTTEPETLAAKPKVRHKQKLSKHTVSKDNNLAQLGVKKTSKEDAMYTRLVGLIRSEIEILSDDDVFANTGKIKNILSKTTQHLIHAITDIRN